MHETESQFSIEIDESHLNEIEDIYNSNIEVFIKLQEDFTAIVIVGTPKNLQYIMEKDKRNFYGPALPWIIVRKLTKEVITEAIQAYIDHKPEGYWLKLYHFANKIDIAALNKLRDQEIQESVQFKLLSDLDDLKRKINKLNSLEKSDLMVSLKKLYDYTEI